MIFDEFCINLLIARRKKYVDLLLDSVLWDKYISDFWTEKGLPVNEIHENAVIKQRMFGLWGIL